MSPSRLLIVEDEPLIRMVLEEALRDAGFDVEAAGRADEGLRLLREQGVAFDAIIVDLGLPDRADDGFAEEIRALWPDLPMVITSGRSMSRLTGLFLSDRRARIIGKPYKIETLCGALAAMGITADPGD